jgi:hypothetical protein
MRDAAVSKLICDLAQVELVIKKQLLYLLDLLSDNLLFQGYSFNG